MDSEIAFTTVKNVIKEMHGVKAAMMAEKILGEVVASIIHKEQIYDIPSDRILAAFIDTIKALDKISDIECEHANN